MRNKEKYAFTKKKWARNNPDKIRDYQYRTLYGISLSDYNLLFEKQKGCCAICNKHQTEIKRRLFVDHSHTTGEVRGLLCFGCNTNLGWLERNKEEVNNFLRGGYGLI